jgi:N-acetyltransferase
LNWLEAVTLEGNRVRLEPLDPASHAPAMFEFFEPQVMAFVTIGARAIESLADWQAHLETILQTPGQVHWAVRVLETDAVAGRVLFHGVQETQRWLTIGTLLMPHFWGGLVNPECKLLLMTRAFEVLGVNRVQFMVHSRNGRSNAALQKMGAVREGVLRAYLVDANGSAQDIVMHSVLRHEWPEVKARLEARVQ